MVFSLGSCTCGRCSVTIVALVEVTGVEVVTGTVVVVVVVVVDITAGGFTIEVAVFAAGFGAAVVAVLLVTAVAAGFVPPMCDPVEGPRGETTLPGLAYLAALK